LYSAAFVAISAARRKSEKVEALVAQELLHAWGVVMRERKMARHNRNIGFFSMIAGSLLAAAVLVTLLVGGEIAGPKVVFNASPPITAR
jgi:hypothetical protein